MDRTTNRRRTVGMLAVAASPIVLAASDLAAPSFAHGEALATAVWSHPDRAWAFALLRLLAAALWIAALVAVAAQARDRGARTAETAAVLGVLGALGLAQDSAYQLIVLGLQGQESATAGAALQNIDQLAGPLELPLILALALSFLLLGVAAHRAGLAARWAQASVVAAFLAHFLPGPIASVTADALLIATYLHIATRLRSTSHPTPQPTIEPSTLPAT